METQELINVHPTLPPPGKRVMIRRTTPLKFKVIPLSEAPLDLEIKGRYGKLLLEAQKLPKGTCIRIDAPEQLELNTIRAAVELHLRTNKQLSGLKIVQRNRALFLVRKES